MSIDYKNFITGKRIVFVGACPNLVGKGLGLKIDSYDIVIRSNHSWSFNSEEYKKDYGSRCDVLYINRQYYREMRDFILSFVKESSTSWFCMKGCSKQDKILLKPFINIRTLKETISKVNLELHSATMGAYIIYDLLKLNPKELYLTGVDFFASKSPRFILNNYQEYLPGYLPPKIVKQGNKINLGKVEDGHNFLGNARFFKKLFNENKHLKTDNFIMEILNKIVKCSLKQGQIKWT